MTKNPLAHRAGSALLPLAAALLVLASSPLAAAQAGGNASPPPGSGTSKREGGTDDKNPGDDTDDKSRKDAKKSSRGAAGTKQRQLGDPATEARLQLRLDPEDRRALDRALQYTLPAVPTENVEWIGGDALTVEAMRGRVVVIQSLSVRSNWRGVVEGLRRQFDDAGESPADAPIVILLHTPDGADKARQVLEPVLDGWRAVVDKDGAWCDALGVWKRPVNLVVDRNGIVRYAGLTPPGVSAAVDILLAEQADPSAAPKVREEAAPAADATFPTFRDPLRNASDRRGQPMPALQVQNWLNGQPDPGQRLVVIEFWATWCPPCRASIPHMNQLAERFSSDVCFVGLSSESNSNFEEGCRKHDLKERDFKYALALDSQKRLESYFAVTGPPHCVAISADGIVRWQGLPGQLTDDVLRPMIAANNALASGAGGGGSRGWKTASTGGKPAGGAAPPPRKRY